MTDTSLELMTDTNMSQFIEKGLRGGITFISKRYSKANKYIEDYDEDKESKYITHLDAINLYSWGMSQSRHAGQGGRESRRPSCLSVGGEGGAKLPFINAMI